MTQSVIHHPRVAWDGARTFVWAAGTTDYYEAFAGQVASYLGAECATALAATRERILTGWPASGSDRHVIDVELGLWRVRLEDLLRTRPDLIEAIRELTFPPR